MRVAGIDGCKGGWVAVHATLDSLHSAQVSFVADLEAFVADFGIDLAVVDIPIGFSSGPSGRDVEKAMRDMLKGKSASVFNTPCRQSLAEDSYALASETNHKVLGKKLTKQTRAIFPKMREMDRIVRSLSQCRIREGHPEVTFAVMNGQPVLSRKKTSAGQTEREALLNRMGFDAGHLRDVERGLGAARDDVLDAAALAWSATRLHENRHITLPPSPSMDAVGLEMSVIA